MEFIRGSCDLCDCECFESINNTCKCKCTHGDVWHIRLYCCKICNKSDKSVCGKCNICTKCLDNLINCPIAEIN